MVVAWYPKLLSPPKLQLYIIPSLGSKYSVYWSDSPLEILYVQGSGTETILVITILATTGQLYLCKHHSIVDNGRSSAQCWNDVTGVGVRGGKYRLGDRELM